MPNPFRVDRKFHLPYPGLSLRSNPGLQLVNAFGVTIKMSLLLGREAFVDRFDPAVGFDEAAAPRRPFGR